MTWSVATLPQWPKSAQINRTLRSLGGKQTSVVSRPIHLPSLFSINRPLSFLSPSRLIVCIMPNCGKTFVHLYIGIHMENDSWCARHPYALSIPLLSHSVLMRWYLLYMFFSQCYTAMECGENMEYQPCGDACLPTCADRDGSTCGDLGPCGEGCFCKTGFVFDGQDSCIKDTNCGCVVPALGIYINVSIHTMTVRFYMTLHYVSKQRVDTQTILATCIEDIY